MEPQITRYAQSAIRIDSDGLHIYIDPFQLPEGQPPADVLLISHEHRDHLSPEDIAKIRVESTAVFASARAAEQIPGPVRALRPGDTEQHGGLRLWAVPAYNVNKFRSPGVPFHPRENENLGFVIEVDDLSFYFAGDTDVIPEMEQIGPVDYAFLPVSGQFVMTAEEAAEAARIVQPSVAIPVHYGALVGSVEDARRFASLVPDQVRVWILPSVEEEPAS